MIFCNIEMLNSEKSLPLQTSLIKIGAAYLPLRIC